MNNIYTIRPVQLAVKNIVIPPFIIIMTADIATAYTTVIGVAAKPVKPPVAAQ